MDPLSSAASVIAVIQLTGGIVKICRKYLNNVKNAKQDIQGFQEKIADLAKVLRSLDELIRGSDGNKLTVTQDLVDNIAKCSSALTNLEENQPGNGAKTDEEMGPSSLEIAAGKIGGRFYYNGA
ncbi:hypothetical protein VN97_g12182 [Penicillium thymicola]|uniref:Azaphilone pigments biosynthesis cluster protein L N-terminal domain-containing protein n=1 Tax=Penicillium thymicola TaxID=293382 RepID=A0AAI9X2C9_PENTH|nr:hypothetical protein VN97_g12182 [Penicillium thymicola]